MTRRVVQSSTGRPPSYGVSRLALFFVQLLSLPLGGVAAAAYMPARQTDDLDVAVEADRGPVAEGGGAESRRAHGVD